VVPGTFTSLESSSAIKNSSTLVIRTIQNPPLIAISCVFLVIGASGMLWLSWKLRHNYIWLGKLFRWVGKKPWRRNANSTVGPRCPTPLSVYSQR
jgi:hypothetical protein